MVVLYWTELPLRRFHSPVFYPVDSVLTFTRGALGL